MKNFLLIASSILLLSSCTSKKSLDVDTLPKDISLKPDNIIAQQKDKEKLNVLIKEIEAMISTETCDDAAKWNFTAIGAKPCGGPSSYLAYPKDKEAEILQKIKEFTAMQSTFNVKYNLNSDCTIVAEPTGIECRDGKAVLFSGTSGVEN